MPGKARRKRKKGGIKKTSFSDQMKENRAKKGKPTSVDKFQKSLRKSFGFDKKK